MAQRTGLKKIVEQRIRFRGTFVRLGFRPAFRGPDLQTVLILLAKSTEGVVG